MTTPLTLTPGRCADGRPRLAAVGEIDMSNIGVLAQALDDTPGPLVLDLTEVEYLDSAGLSVLFAHADRLEVIASPCSHRSCRSPVSPLSPRCTGWAPTPPATSRPGIDLRRRPAPAALQRRCGQTGVCASNARHA